MDEKIDSDLTMVTNKSFNDVLQCVQNSCLNYQIQMSPFSAIISLKKSLLKDKSGSPIMPKLQTSDELNRSLEIELVLMKRNYEDLLLKHAKAVETIKVLEDAINVRDMTAGEILCVPPKLDEDLVKGVEEIKKCEEETKSLKEFYFDGETFRNNLGNTIQHDASTVASKPRVSQPSGLAYDPSFNYTEPPTLMCSMCSHVMPDCSVKYYSGYKLRPLCNTCTKKDHLEDTEPDPFSAFPSSEIPSSLVTHWIEPFKLGPSQNIASSTSFLTHCIKWPNPGGSLYTADEILHELKELLKKSKWWT